jgi:hypothetical protein
MRFLRKVTLVASAFLLAFAPVNSAFAALPESLLNFYAQNNILFYDPGSNGCMFFLGGGAIGAESSSEEGASAETQILSSTELDAIKHFKPTYEKYANQYGFPWQILAAMHYTTNKATLNNPSDGAGVYHHYPFTHNESTGRLNDATAYLPAGQITQSEFENQTKYMSMSIKAYSERNGWNLNTDNGLEQLFKALNNASNANAQRTLELTKIIDVADSDGSIKNSIDACTFDGEQLTDAQAQALADYYNSAAVDAGFWGLPYGKMNCVSFSAWFVQALTSVGRDPHAWGNGGQVAMNLNLKYGIPIGTEPMPFAVFSTKGNSGFGHTGVIVAVNGDDVTIVDASYPTGSMAGSLARVRHVSRGYFSGGFIAYLGGIMDESKLGAIVGN